MRDAVSGGDQLRLELAPDATHGDIERSRRQHHLGGLSERAPEQPAAGYGDRGPQLTASVGRTQHVLDVDRDRAACDERKPTVLGIQDVNVEFDPATYKQPTYSG